MKYVGVQHEQYQGEYRDVVYWFVVIDDIADHVRINSRVICDTRRGKNDGRVVYILEGIPEEMAKSIIGERFFPLRQVVSVYMDVNLEDIFIPWETEVAAPEVGEIARSITHYYVNGKFQAPVKLMPNMALCDGYTDYLAAKMFGHNTLSCAIVPWR